MLAKKATLTHAILLRKVSSLFLNLLKDMHGVSFFILRMIPASCSLRSSIYSASSDYSLTCSSLYSSYTQSFFMGLTRPYQIKYSDGQYGVTELIDCVNVSRTPAVRDKIIDGTFNRIPAQDGKGFITVEKSFFYADFDRHQFYLVRPRSERHTWKEASAQLERMIAKVPGFISDKRKRQVRAVFGLGELREKIIAAENSIDDRMLELLKVLVIYDHPFLIKKARLRIYLEKINETNFEFFACYDHAKNSYRIRMPKTVTDNLIKDRRKEVEAWAKSRLSNNIFELKNDHWINFWRWSPATIALNSLSKYSKDIAAGKTINVEEKEFSNMLQYLPRGSQLPSWAKKSLHDLYLYARKNHEGKLEDSFFEIRFDHELDDDWHKNDDPKDIDTIWNLLNDLPETNVEGNTDINEIMFDKGEGGGSYQPDTHDIYIGSDELHNKERFEDTLRHEVGHAVHEKNTKLVDDWLHERFGWLSFDIGDKNIDAWVHELGGYGDTTPEQKREVRNFLKQALGSGNVWAPPRRPAPPRGHPWNKNNYAPRLVCERSHESWFTSYDSWYRINGRAFFLNYYYQMFMIVNESTLKLIDAMPDNYAAMSPFEFFAELYALHYDKDDPKRKNIPKDVAAWMNENIGKARSSNKKIQPIARTKKSMPGRKKA